MKKGFAPIGIIFVTAIIATLAGGSAYGVHKYNQVLDEKELIEKELLQKKDEEIRQLKEAVERLDKQEINLEEEIERDVTVSTQESEPKVKEVNNIIEAKKTVTEFAGVPDEKLVISNVQTEEYGDSTFITWETNLISDSRIIIDDNFYVSDASNAIEHSVSFSDLAYNSVINYEIVAETDTLEASKFGKFTTRLGELTTRFTYSKNEDCIVVIVEDPNGDAQPGIELHISSDWYAPSGSRFLNETLVQETNAWGEVEYCEKNIENIEVSSVGSADVYYDGVLPLYY